MTAFIPIFCFKSNHFYCHITTAHVPCWVKLLRPCSRQCRNNLHIDTTYQQTYWEDNVQNTHTYSQYTQCTIRHTYISLWIIFCIIEYVTNKITLNLEPWVINTHYTPCIHILHYVHIYTHNNMRRCNKLYIILDTQCHGCALDGIQL